VYDCLIKGARVIDGSGNPSYHTDVALASGKIAALGRLGQTEAMQRVDAHGRVLAPGFIDGHAHSEPFALVSPNSLMAKVSQGVTTEIVGVCGTSAFPLTEQTTGMSFWRLPILQEYLTIIKAEGHGPWYWRGYADLASALRNQRLPTNVGSMVGHGSVRAAVVGSSHRAPSAGELKRMQQLVDQSLDEGAVGVSFGLAYPPGSCATARELAAMAEVAARRGRPCSVHLRDEGDRLLESIEEMLEVAVTTGCSLIISHLKAAGKANWGKVDTALTRIEKARSDGLDVCLDVYPYTAGSPLIVSLLPPWASSGGLPKLLDRLQDDAQRLRIANEVEESSAWENLARGAGWDRITLLGYPPNPQVEGTSLMNLAQARKAEPADLLMDLILESQGTATVVVADMDRGDVDAVVNHPLSMLVSDGGASSGMHHPRLHGAFARFLNRYVRELASLSLEEAVRKMTSFPAQTYNLTDRGLIKPGLRADLVLFDPDAVTDTSTYRQPNQVSEGFRAVFVGGQSVYLDGRLTGNWSGEPVVI
jgi:N-acyl-D-amino-acid deacylase